MLTKSPLFLPQRIFFIYLAGRFADHLKLSGKKEKELENVWYCVSPAVWRVRVYSIAEGIAPAAFRSCPWMAPPFISDGVKTPCCQWRSLAKGTSAAAAAAAWPEIEMLVYLIEELSAHLSFSSSYFSWLAVLIISSPLTVNGIFSLSGKQASAWWWFKNARRVLANEPHPSSSGPMRLACKLMSFSRQFLHFFPSLQNYVFMLEIVDSTIPSPLYFSIHNQSGQAAESDTFFAVRTKIFSPFSLSYSYFTFEFQFWNSRGNIVACFIYFYI